MMEQGNKRLRELLELQLENRISSAEQIELWYYVDDPLYSGVIRELLGEAYALQDDQMSLSGKQSMQVLRNILPVAKVQPLYKRSWWPRIAVAAAMVCALLIGSYYYRQSQWTAPQLVSAKNDIAPGKNGATLTLANGKTILINDALTGNLVEESGVRISKTQDGQLRYELTNTGSGKLEYNTLSTTRGQQSQVRLPDGTLVFLNAESSLKYPTSFAKLDKREVFLTGEGYFEVAKDKAHPFMVKAANQQVEVLGTHFNINSYDDEPSLKTTLLEGSVKVSIGKEFKVLSPDQQTQLVGDRLLVAKVVAEDAVAWKNGLFVFEDETLESVMRRVGRWYDVEVVYQQGVNKNERYFGSVSRYDKVSKVLEGLELTKGIHFKIEGRRILVMR